MFALDEPNESFKGLDKLIDKSLEDDMFPIAQLVKGHPKNKQKRQKTVHLKPVAFAHFNTRLGKGKTQTVKALLDSGGAESIVTEQYAKHLRMRTTTGKKWSTPAGDLTTKKKCKTQFTLPELHDDRVVEWDFHVTKSLGAHDMTIGRDILEFLGIDIKFSDKTIEWGFATMPFKDQDAGLNDFYLEEPQLVEEASDRLKKILDAKYEAADLEAVYSSQEELSPEEQQKLLRLLKKYEGLFDGTLGTWTGTKVNIELNEGAIPYHARSFPMPRCHMETLKVEVDRLCKLGGLKRVNRSQWAAPTFPINKKDGTVRFISDFRELNKRIKRRPYPIPHIQDMLTNLGGFQHATSLDLNMGYYHL